VTGVLLLVARLLLDGPLASELAGGPWLVRVCERESLCPVGLVHEHAGDAWMGRTLGEGNGTRGPHGMVWAFTKEHLPGWAPRWSIDVPLVSAIAATRRAGSWRCRQVRACRSWAGLPAARRGPSPSR